MSGRWPHAKSWYSGVQNRLSRCLRAVRAGQTLVIAARGKAVAKLSLTGEEKSDPNSLRERLEELQARGLIRLGRRRLAKFHAVKSRGKTAPEMTCGPPLVL
jgi:antitoxin (DNA-binding transcriptional repressor) of toxin-antitoxin stability system